MKAAIIAIGSELLGPERVDTNSLEITRALERHAIDVVRKTVVGDDPDAIGEELQRAMELAELVFVTGGLGPTEDDCTREAVAAACGLDLERDESLLSRLEQRFAERGMEMPAVNARQAHVFVGQTTLENPRGTAPGHHLELGGPSKRRHVWIFPGVPWELEGMIENDLVPWLETHSVDGGALYRRIVRITGLTESAVEEKLASFYARRPGESFTILSTASEIQIHLKAGGTPDEAFTNLYGLEAELREIFGERIYGIDQDDLESVVGRMMMAVGATVAIAESCTGGLLGSRITDVSGSSAYFMGGIIAYSREAKMRELGIPAAILDEHGQVSEETSRAMAARVREKFGTTYGIGITGIAGPSGGSPRKPVGTVHVAVAGEDETKHRRFTLPPPRARIKHLTTQIALDLLRVMLLRR